MKIKKFQAKSFAEALIMVKKELSDDAIILSTEEGDCGVEVTAAVDYDMQKSRPNNKSTEKLQNNIRMFNTTAGKAEEAKDAVSLKSIFQPKQKVSTGGGLFKQAAQELPVEIVKKPAAANSPSAAKTESQAPEATHSITSVISSMALNISSEIEQLRETIEDMKNMGFEMSMPPKKKAILSYLRERSIQDEYAILLCEKAKEVQDILPIISSHIKVKKAETDMKAVMLIGPTGVGKTTTVAKLAAHSIKEGKKTAIINYDTYRIGAVEQVRIYARILGIPLAVVSTPTELKTSLLRFAETKDIIYIDTTGRNPKDNDYLDSINEICETEVPLETHLLMSANSDGEFMSEAYRYYRTVPVNYIGFTKVDEAVRYGALYNLLMMYSKPVAYVTTGQKVPDDIDFTAVEGMAGLILKKECYRC
ncbi:flagellar biosynthesis protein FlhF [Candidatus Magnetominusculus xianensis]|uniref:Flagellar biosynthesis protein FlhF n=1 Tax=Candidatus Magnetominusculus xianensis TaxID=1748249 RepID=A0ABR5SE99_9BACT|nr:flagellar biosynthesis protein FlhF [Candidatus Magnetominusculus xianensis]KWT84085.1 flagellar biosynthesis regulator FlhF [Candidatus Magnetominusculus xianensis]MBF0402378.1 flagellar biosynthesis protein FlhF [Nitrospirota bacterium]